MQSCRVSRTLPRNLRKPQYATIQLNTILRPLSTTAANNTNNMSVFTSYPRTFFGPADTSFTPLFRFLDDFDSYTREGQGNGNGRRGGRHHIRSFNPKFDVRETDAAYELHGELPGVERDQLSIEFTDPQTLVVRGRVERSYTAGTPPAGVLEGGKAGAAITEAGEPAAAKDDDTAAPAAPSHKATVEDEGVEEARENGTPVTSAPGTPTTEEVATAQKPSAPATPAEKFWVAERSVGEFSRTFNLPARVEQEGVSASLNNGILTVVVPKAKKHESRRIAIN